MKRFPRLNLKNINRLFMLAVVFAPFFYLFGSLFTALNGSHEGFPFAYADRQPVSESYNATYGVWANADTGVVGDYVNCCMTSLLPIDNSIAYNISFESSSATIFYIYPYDEGVYLGRFLFEPSTEFYFDNDVTDIRIGLASVSTSVEINVTKYLITFDDSKQGAVDFVFSQFFAKDNFLVKMGKDSLSADPNGFAPANSLVQLLDGSVFHFGTENQIACMAYGYAVWVFNAVVLDMVIVLSLKLLLLPLRAVEIFEKGEKE